MKQKYYLLFLLFLLISSLTYGQISLRKDIYDAFIKSDLSLWEKAVSNCEKRVNLAKEEDQFELIHYYYGYASTLIGKKENEKAKQIIAKANTLIDKILSEKPNSALAMNYRGVFMGYEVTFNKLKAVQTGHKSVKLINDALKSDPQNIQILFDKANTLYYTPSLFGGNKKEALTYYQKLRKLIEKKYSNNKNWIYMQVLFAEAHCLELNSQLEDAKKAYEYILKLEPNYKLVKDKYYPNLLNKLKN